MNRRQGITQHDHFDLFPYIGLLMCLLGALLMTTMGLAALSLGPSAGEVWDLPKVCCQVVKKPVLVEWDGLRAVVREQRGARTIEGFSGADKDASRATDVSKDMKLLIAHFARPGGMQYPLFALRPSGFDSFPRLAAAFRRAEVPIGYEPIAQDRSVRLRIEEQKP